MRKRGRHVDPEIATIALGHLQFKGLRLAIGEHALVVQVIRVLVGLDDEAGDALARQRAAGQAQQLGGGEVCLLNQAVFIDRAIRHRGEVIQVEIALARCIQIKLGAAQLFVLHLQFNLVHLQLMHRLPHGLGRQALRLPGRRGGAVMQQPLCLLAPGQRIQGCLGCILRR